MIHRAPDGQKEQNMGNQRILNRDASCALRRSECCCCGVNCGGGAGKQRILLFISLSAYLGRHVRPQTTDSRTTKINPRTIAYSSLYMKLTVLLEAWLWKALEILMEKSEFSFGFRRIHDQSTMCLSRLDLRDLLNISYAKVISPQLFGYWPGEERCHS
jgi:hypothetical protein